MISYLTKATKQILDKYKLKAFIKTSGKTGLHIYLPCAGIGFQQSRAIANAIGDEIQPLVKAISTRDETISHREDFDILNTKARLEKKGDLFAEVLDPKIANSNTKILLKRFG